MSDIILGWGGLIGGIIIAVISGLFSIFGKRRTTEQEMIKTLLGRVESLDEDVAEVRAELRIRDDYIFALRRWIADEKPPPPPPWPEGLT